MEVVLVVFLYIVWKVFWVYVVFENVVVVVSGVEVVWKKIGRKGKIFVIGGDGGIVDIGF